MILSVIIPVYNEEKTIIKVLEKVKNSSSNLFKYEIIVIDDGSNDESKSLLEKNKHLYDKLIINISDRGKGYSVKKGIESSSGTHIIFQDADFEYDPADFKKFDIVHCRIKQRGQTPIHDLNLGMVHRNRKS